MPFRTVCVDFDGILNVYTGWAREGDLYSARPGARDFLARLKKAGYRVVIHSTRGAECLHKWLTDNRMMEFVDEIASKPLGFVYLDDRGLRFDGNFDDAFSNITRFRPYWQEAYPTAASYGNVPPYGHPRDVEEIVHEEMLSPEQAAAANVNVQQDPVDSVGCPSNAIRQGPQSQVSGQEHQPLQEEGLPAEEGRGSGPEHRPDGET